ncbi:hypothetical protein EVAR_55749_1 [Eumeta japonica]|uniref:Uncharacterized protein n=1 Tax=Eumeta variegata TaxID=151549 RepID=A0A4C1XED2_EUMVA|nr:hypothetical protein EVAR_55749_1 [Eumeta japonica]
MQGLSREQYSKAKQSGRSEKNRTLYRIESCLNIESSPGTEAEVGRGENRRQACNQNRARHWNRNRERDYGMLRAGSGSDSIEIKKKKILDRDRGQDQERCRGRYRH